MAAHMLTVPDRAMPAICQHCRVQTQQSQTERKTSIYKKQSSAQHCQKVAYSKSIVVTKCDHCSQKNDS